MRFLGFIGSLVVSLGFEGLGTAHRFDESCVGAFDDPRFQGALLGEVA